MVKQNNIIVPQKREATEPTTHFIMRRSSLKNMITRSTLRIFTILRRRRQRMMTGFTRVVSPSDKSVMASSKAPPATRHVSRMFQPLDSLMKKYSLCTISFSVISMMYQMVKQELATFSQPMESEDSRSLMFESAAQRMVQVLMKITIMQRTSKSGWNTMLATGPVRSGSSASSELSHMQAFATDTQNAFVLSAGKCSLSL
mmetsp:Transcript_2324/g.4606  ORF Transcript_2324/g.4606 Transcript_2324/m.4606 type:complete len:201 (-) Transcript_2324:714-1316(-)